MNLLFIVFVIYNISTIRAREEKSGHRAKNVLLLWCPQGQTKLFNKIPFKGDWL